MSHELRTPLNAVLGFTRLMQRDGDVPEGHRSNLAIVNRSGEHLLAMINSILDLSKVEAGQTIVHLAPFDLPQLLQDVIQMMRPHADAKGITLALELAAELPRHIQSDSGKIRQILINLMNNAVKFTDCGGVHLAATLLVDASGGDFLELAVADSGQGIDPRTLPHIFDAFVQADNGDGNGEGTGLGLAICRPLVTLLGGEIEACSELGVGSRFAFMIPITRITDHNPSATTASRHVVGLVPGQPQYRLLIVEDNPANQQLLRITLETVGLSVRVATDGTEGIAQFKAWRPDLIWMDLRMPVMDGKTATEHIRALPGGGDCRIIAVTASAFHDHRDSLLASGFDDFLLKPFSDAALFALLERHLDLHFDYRDDEPDAGMESLNTADLHRLDTSWLSEFLRAIRIGNVLAQQDLLHQLRPEHPALAAALGTLIDAYAFERLTGIIEPILAHRDPHE